MKRLVPELAAVAVAMLAANLLISPANLGWVGLQPHPFLIGIALVAGRYGSLAGGLLALLLFGLYEALTRGANPVQPPHAGLWASCVLVATLIGGMFDQTRHRQHSLAQDLEHTQQELEKLRGENVVLESAARELRSRILGQGETFERLYALARQLTTLSQDQLYRSSLELACRQTEASQAHFFVRQGSGWTPVAHYPPGSTPKLAPEHSQLVQLALQAGQPVSAHRQLELQSTQEPVVVVPLMAEDQRTAMAVWTVEKLPFHRLNPSTLGILEAVADWTARALTQLGRYSEKESLVEEERTAHQHLLEKLSVMVVPPRDLPLLEAVAEPMSELLLRSLDRARNQPILRTNALQILERLHLTPTELDFAAGFVERELAWVRAADRELDCLLHQPHGQQLSLLQIYLRRRLGMAREVVLRAQGLVKPLPAATLQAALELPLAGSQGPMPRALFEQLAQWGGPALAEAIDTTVALAPKEVGQITLEEQVLEFLGSQDVYLLCATLHCLGRLAQVEASPWRDPAPGAPPSLAVELCSHPDARVREAAFACVLALQQAGAGPYPALLAQGQQDPDPRVQRLLKGH